MSSIYLPDLTKWVPFLIMIRQEFFVFQLKDVQDKVNREKVWVMKFEDERVKTGKKLFGDKFPGSTNQESTDKAKNPTRSLVVPARTPVAAGTKGTRQVKTSTITCN